PSGSTSPRSSSRTARGSRAACWSVSGAPVPTGPKAMPSMSPEAGDRAHGPLAIGLGSREAARRGAHASLDGACLSALAQAVFGLRSTGDLATACAIACSCAQRAMDAVGSRLLRMDPRSGALRRGGENRAETPFFPQPRGPGRKGGRDEGALFDERRSAESPREAPWWGGAPAALAALPLATGSVVYGMLVLGFPAPRRFGPSDRLFLQTLADALAMTLERFELRGLLAEEHQRLAELEHQLSSDEEASSSLMSVVAHEIRTPLTAIKAYTH